MRYMQIKKSRKLVLKAETRTELKTRQKKKCFSGGTLIIGVTFK